MKTKPVVFIVCIFLFQGAVFANSLIWPVACVPGVDCTFIGYPDIDNDGVAFDCGSPGYRGHTGTDVSASKGTPIYAADDGEVQWVFDGKDDNCPSSSPDCQPPPDGWSEPGKSRGYRVCTDLGPYCGNGDNCQGLYFLCFDGGNEVLIRHKNSQSLFMTRYAHFRKNSIVVSPGETVKKGQKIGEVGSAGRSTEPHLHFEAWGSGYWDIVDPWMGACGPNFSNSLWTDNATPWNTYLGDCGHTVYDAVEKVGKIPCIEVDGGTTYADILLAPPYNVVDMLENGYCAKAKYYPETGRAVLPCVELGDSTYKVMLEPPYNLK